MLQQKKLVEIIREIMDSQRDATNLDSVSNTRTLLSGAVNRLIVSMRDLPDDFWRRRLGNGYIGNVEEEYFEGLLQIDRYKDTQQDSLYVLSCQDIGFGSGVWNNGPFFSLQGRILEALYKQAETKYLHRNPH